MFFPWGLISSMMTTAIAAGECWCRIIARLAARTLQSAAKELLAPLQLAVAIPGGVEIAARACQLFLEDDPDGDMALFSLDLRNAFNSIRRRRVYDGLAKYCPLLIPLFRSFYGGVSEIRDGRGRFLCHNGSGVRQGDPLAFLAFCCGFQDALTALQREFSLVLQEHDKDDEHHLMIAYADDISGGGPREVVMDFVPRAARIMALFGMELRLDKCKVIAPHAPAPTADPPPFSVSINGGVILGVPVGDVGFRRDTCLAMVDEMLEPLPVLLSPRVARQSAYALLH